MRNLRRFGATCNAMTPLPNASGALILSTTAPCDMDWANGAVVKRSCGPNNSTYAMRAGAATRAKYARRIALRCLYGRQVAAGYAVNFTRGGPLHTRCASVLLPGPKGCMPRRNILRPSVGARGRAWNIRAARYFLATGGAASTLGRKNAYNYIGREISIRTSIGRDGVTN